MWVCHRNGMPDLSTLGYYKKSSIKAFMSPELTQPWAYFRDKFGWRCDKVAIDLTLFTKPKTITVINGDIHL